jgi:hypothetical protein
MEMLPSLTWAGSIHDPVGEWPRESLSHCTSGRAILASLHGGHARHNLWQRGLAFARPSPKPKPKLEDDPYDILFLCEFVSLLVSCKSFVRNSNHKVELRQQTGTAESVERKNADRRV